MKLSEVRESEVNQKEEHQYSILTHAHTHIYSIYIYSYIYMEFRKTGATTQYARHKRDKAVNNRLWDSVGEG